MKKFNLRIIACLMMAVMISACFGHVGTAMAAKAAHTGELTVAGEDDYWGQHDTTMAEVLGDVALEDVTYIRFYSNAGFVLGYNNGAVDWYQTDKVTEYVMEDLNKDPNKWTLAIIANEFTGTKVTVKWEVYTIGTPADNKADTEKAGETIALETIVNPSWGVYSNLIPSDTLAKYPDGVVFDIALEVEGDYALLTPINDTTNWPKLIKETAGVEFNSDDGEFIVFGADTKNLKMTLTAKGVKTVLATGSGVRFQGNQLKFKEVTLTAVPPKATPTPKPTATPIPTPTPVPVTEELYKTVGTVLLVTEDMVENGKVVIERAQYNSIIIPANLNADVTLKTVKAEEVVVEGGADYTVTLYYCDVEKVDVTAPEVKVMTVAELNEALQAEDADADAIIEQFQADLAAKKAADLAKVELVTTYFTEVEEINVKASAKIDANAEQCEVAKINIAVADVDQTQTVLVKNYNGAVAADLERADGAFASMFTLELENAKLSVLDVTGADSSCFIEGEASVVDALNVANAANIALNAATGKVTVAEEADGAKVRVYSSVNEVTVKSDATSIVLPTCAKIGNAVVEGNNVKVYGYGKLDTAVITGTGANVAVYGTAVDGENDSTPPAAMLAMSPQKAPQKSDRPVKPEDDAIYTFTYAEYAKVKEESNGALSPCFQFELRDYGLEGLQAKDKVRVTVTFNGSGDYHACISANKWDGSPEGTWHSIKDMSTNGRTTLSGVFEVPHGESWVNAQAQIFWMPENSADIKVESVVVEKVVEEEGPLYTFTEEELNEVKAENPEAAPKYEFDLNDYLEDAGTGDKVKVSITFSSDTYYGGGIQGNCLVDGAPKWDTVGEQYSNEAGATWTGTYVVPYNGEGNVLQVQLYWIGPNGSVNIDAITVEHVEEGPLYTFTEEEFNEVKAENPEAAPKYEFDLNDYLEDAGTGDKVKVSITFSSDTYYGGGIQGNCLVDGAPKWDTVGEQYSNEAGATWTGTYVVPYNGEGNVLQVQLYWIGPNGSVNIDAITAELVTE